jgi:predicted DNA-binding ribbon-helix-helix protein
MYNVLPLRVKLALLRKAESMDHQGSSCCEILVGMQATVELPEVVLQQLEVLARREGATPGDLIRRIVEDHVARSQPSLRRSLSVSLPIIPASETGPIGPITGKAVDELLSNDHLTA